MFSLALKSAFRQLWKQKMFTTVNLVGLSLGLASVMALLIGVYLYMTTDSMHRDNDRMYYLKSTSPEGQQHIQTTYPLLDEVLKNSPAVEAGTHAQNWYAPWLKNGDREVQDNTLFVDTGFFRVFSFPLKYGNPATALRDKYAVVLSTDMANQLFGRENPVGKVITADDTLQLTVTGVMEKIPTNSSVSGEVIMTTALLKENQGFRDNANWYNGFAVNFVKLRPGADTAAVNREIGKQVLLNYEPSRNKDIVRLVPFSSMRDEAGPIINVIIKGSIGTALFVLLIVLVNLLNLNAATIYSRSREVAVRQIIGSSKAGIIRQFCIENGLIVFGAILLAGLLFFTILLPELNEMYGSRFGDMSVSLRKDYPFVLLFAVIGVLVTIIAGTLPALKLINTRVADGVKGRLHHGGNSHRIRNIFIAFQFTLAIIFICITVILNRQIDFMKQASPGFNTTEVAVVSLDLAFKNPAAAGERFTSILARLKANPDVKSVSTNSVIPTAYWSNYNNYYDPATSKEITLRHMGADAGFLPTFEIPVIAGRNFDDAVAATENTNIMINRTAMKALGWTDIVGKQLKAKGNTEVFNVIGVMEDFHYEDMQNAIEPLLHWYGGKQGLANNNYLSILVANNKTKQVLQQLEADFKTIPARRPFKEDRIGELVTRQYAMIDGILKTTNFVALLTIIISCMGMFGLISLFSKQRVKEIGIRKVLGAEVPQIIHLLTKDFIKLVVIACVVAFPVAWYTMDTWLQSFASRISIEWWMFAFGGAAALLIALITVGTQALRAAVANPVNSLRTE